MSRRSRSTSIVDNFVTHRREMRESPAWRHLPDDARRVLFQLEMEHMRNGGADNGKLACRHADFHEQGGVRRNSVALAIRQCVALGFVEITHHARPAIAEHRRSSLYRLTYVFSHRHGPKPTDDWRRIETDDAAHAALARAAAVRSEEHVRRQANSPSELARRAPVQAARRPVPLPRI